ncbi:alpha/beta hydrolase [Pseudoclavibacter sp. CFCC 13796]|uniref:alpha/beta hydrolase n=1 Tax=Pseudoclavibacter sp. CFCC 13796 TaxID=2615179 RepID=UPI001300E790|nr:alpha/beta hydrolase [Pseudoclavibacter sp. CFCC 13796]KAB1660947.1 alpha/beta hydrolase [Pseudoclavibacter sp. CFCC 13796]
MQTFTPPDGRWHPDVLGDDFEQRTLPLGVDAEGDVFATLVRYRPKDAARSAQPGRLPAGGQIFAGWDVLYVHGWNDYFFHPHVARWFAERGARFYALDLRKYGRSLRPGQTHGLISNLNEYDYDIATALEAMADDPFEPTRARRPLEEIASLLTPARRHHAHKRRLALFGHSTGGLILSLWADRHAGRADALLLNSPWLELQAKAIGRQVIAPMLELQSRVDPHNTLPSIDLGYYNRSVSAEARGQWTFNEEWRLPRGCDMPAIWLSAVLAGHARVAAGLDVRIPILTMTSAHSTLSTTWNDAMLRTDSVLNVRDVAERALGLGAEVTVVRIEDALHDIFLSRPLVRQAAFAAIERWAGGYLR